MLAIDSKVIQGAKITAVYADSSMLLEGKSNITVYLLVSTVYCGLEISQDFITWPIFHKL